MLVAAEKKLSCNNNSFCAYLIELALGFWMMGMPYEGLERHFIKGVILILMIAKAFYIVGYFMHLRHEIRNLIMTIVVPLFLFVWFIIAFLIRW